MSDQLITGEVLLDDLRINLIDGTKIRIGGCHVDVILKLRGLDTWQIMDVMMISDDDLLGAIEQRRKVYCDRALKYFDKVWEFPETGEALDLNDRDLMQQIFGIHATWREIITLLKRRARKITLRMVIDIINVFEKGNVIREVEV